nr:hypothetical protein [Tanacetum cinerariifolium]
QQEREDKRMTGLITRDAEVARIHTEEELQGMIDSLDRTNETIAKYLQEYQDFASELPLERRIELIKKVKEMMQLVPIEEVYVQALQVKHPIIDWKHLDREDLNQLWVLVKEYLSIRPASSDKEMELWVELKRLYEPGPKDQLWAQTQNYMHAPIEWKL